MFFKTFFKNTFWTENVLKYYYLFFYNFNKFSSIYNGETLLVILGTIPPSKENNKTYTSMSKDEV
jgi:hypothetical protein